MFSEEFREDVRNKVLNKAEQDKRIVSAAIVGSYAQNKEDQFSDIDLTFGISEQYTVSELLQSWTEYVMHEYGAIVLFDVQRCNTVYRVFMLPGCLQLDLSFSPEKHFGATGQSFRLLYGKHYEKKQPSCQTKDELLGWVIHHLVRARFCVERNRLWQAEFWLSEARDYILKIACLENGLNPDCARGVDDLPIHILNSLSSSFITSLRREEILIGIHFLSSSLEIVMGNRNPMPNNLNSILNELENFKC